MAAGDWSRKPRDHNCEGKHKTEREKQMWQDHKLLEPTSRDTLPPAKLRDFPQTAPPALRTKASTT